MSSPPDFTPQPGEPMATWTGPEDSLRGLAGLRRQTLEFSSRGDRVSTRLLLPEPGTRRFPLILLAHGAGGSKDADYLDAAAVPWVRHGAAVASIDFPLHGERANGKLSGALLASLLSTPAQVTEPTRSLWVDFVRQAVTDLRRTLDVLALHPELDTARTAYAGFSLGTIVGAVFCAVDPRPLAAALAIGGGGFGPEEVDPARYIARFAPRPVLFVNASRDETISKAAAEALHQAAGEPKRVVWFDTAHAELPGRALKSMWEFLRGPLGLAAEA